MSDEMKKCPLCESPYAYSSGEGKYTCPDCAHEWNLADVVDEFTLIVKDANGNILQNGDAVMVLKDLPVKGSKSSIKSGTKVRNIRLTAGDHNIDCKIEGFGAMALKSEFVKKV